jgi:para-nitrobenzyl esterase
MRTIALCTVATLVVVWTTISTSSYSNAAVSHEVSVDGGIIAGLETSTAIEWRGIPYADPPLGPLRWRPPTPVQPWSEVRSATEFAPPCAQLPLEIGSEDCLYLNVFAPVGIEPDDGLPVMVHLHGGSNLGFRPYQNADAFVRHGVIVVTLGYRLGVFGWLAHPSLTAEPGPSGEYGLFDQLAALEWVQRNIGAFGGDPANVTLFGESAGSFDAAALVASPAVEGLFARAALQTEAYGPFYDPPPLQAVESFGTDVANRAGCGTEANVLECMRQLPTETLLEAFGPTESIPPIGGHLLPASPRDLLATADNTVPLLVGSNREEGAFFVPEVFTTGELNRGYSTLISNFLFAADVGRHVRTLYPIEAYGSNLWATVGMFTDAVYSCPIRALALTTSGPAWRYLYSHTYDNDPFLAQLRAAHFLDDPIMWSDAALLEGFGKDDYEFSHAEMQLSLAMTSYWTNFAKTGDPNGPGLVNWPRFSAAAPLSLELAETIAVRDGWHDQECDAIDEWPLPSKPGWLAGDRVPLAVPLPGPR